MGRTDLRIAVVAGTAFVLLAVLVAVGWGPLVQLDRSVADRANAVAAEHPSWVRAMTVWTHAAGPLTWRLLLLGLGGWLLLRRSMPAAAFTLGAVVIGGVLSTAVKVGVDRARPVVPHPFANAAGMSFPSGHAGTSVIACGVLLVLAWPALSRAWRASMVVLAALVPLTVGYTRIGLDVHWVSDVVGGWLLGLAVVAGAHAVARPNGPARSSGRPASGPAGRATRWGRTR